MLFLLSAFVFTAFYIRKEKATGVINGGIISGIYLLTCATAEGAWTGAVGGGIAGAVGGDVVLPILGTVPGYVGGAILGGIGGAVANGSWYLITGGD
ncbi:putative uncharacterized protein [Streptococcus troglodytae]|uniref:Uncharacterized protein n=1 Tax=Streptococcus troglodytae TaxID=1111760 RepID=A0A1L7LKR7_9STRE|nr:putative uncharacterized protein [Streptococcus troglodytae]